VSVWVAGTAALSLGALAAAYWVPQTASAAGAGGGTVAPPIPHGATVLPDGRYVRPAGLHYNLGDFSLGLAVSPDGRCAASSDEGRGNGRPVPAVPGVNAAGTEADEGVTALNLATGATQFVTVNSKPAQNVGRGRQAHGQELAETGVARAGHGFGHRSVPRIAMAG
jgi:hypothetical protein